MDTPMNFVFTSLHAWGRPDGCNAKSIAERMAQHHKILYVNPPMDLLGVLRGSEGHDRANVHLQTTYHRNVLRQEGHNLWVYTPPLLLMTSPGAIASDTLFDWVNRYNNRRTAHGIEQAMRKVDIASDNFVLINDNDIYNSCYFKELLNPTVMLYYRRDNLSVLPYWRHHGRRLEQQIAREADAVISNSDYLADGIRRQNANTFNVGQGADLITPSDAEKWRNPPRDLNGIRHPILGCIGNLAVRFYSPNLIHKVACEHPRCSVVLIGPEDKVFMHHTLHQLPNVYFLGVKTEQEIMAYIMHFDIIINPLLVNELTNVHYPPLIDECLACGKPVVSMRTDPMDLFYMNVHLADSDHHFSELVDIALLQLNNPTLAERRKNFARGHSWDACCSRIYSVIDSVMRQRNGRIS